MIIENIINHRFLVNFTKYRNLLVELVKRDIKIKYRRSILGLFWSFLEPLLFMIVLTVIFSTLFKSNIQNYPVYILTGRLPYTFFAQGTSAAMSAIYKNAPIIKKIYVPKYMYIIGVTISSLITFLLSFVVLFLVMFATHAPFTLYILLGVVPIILFSIFIIGIGLILATLTVFFRDIEHLYSVILILILYGSAIMFPIQIVPEKYQFLILYNPIYVLITLLRDCFLYGTLFNPFQLIFATVVSIVTLIIGILIFYKYQDKFILYI